MARKVKSLHQTDLNKKSIEEREERANVYRRRVGGQTSLFRRKFHSASIRLRWPTCIFKEERNGYGNKMRVKEVGCIMHYHFFLETRGCRHEGLAVFRNFAGDSRS